MKARAVWCVVITMPSHTWPIHDCLCHGVTYDDAVSLRRFRPPTFDLLGPDADLAPDADAFQPTPLDRPLYRASRDLRLAGDVAECQELVGLGIVGHRRRGAAAWRSYHWGDPPAGGNGSQPDWRRYSSAACRASSLTRRRSRAVAPCGLSSDTRARRTLTDGQSGAISGCATHMASASFEDASQRTSAGPAVGERLLHYAIGRSRASPRWPGESHLEFA